MTELLDEGAMGTLIDAHYRGQGDRLIRMERLPLYTVPQQAAQLQAWREGDQPDMIALQAWLDVLADEVRHGMHTQRVRILSADLSDDELRACHWGYPYVGRFEEIRVLHRGEHPVPDILDHDYWVVRPADGDQIVIRMYYDGDGRFVGAAEVPADQHEPYDRELRLDWAIGEPFDTWWARHGELHRTEAA